MRPWVEEVYGIPPEQVAYDQDSHMGRLDKVLSEAATSGWTVVDMKKEWKVIYP